MSFSSWPRTRPVRSVRESRSIVMSCDTLATELVRLSFELQSTAVALVGESREQCLEHRSDGECRGVARVPRKYGYGERDNALLVLEAGAFRFYVCSPAAAALAQGDRVEFAGTLVRDHYAWAERLHITVTLPICSTTCESSAFVRRARAVHLATFGRQGATDARWARRFRRRRGPRDDGGATL